MEPRQFSGTPSAVAPSEAVQPKPWAVLAVDGDTGRGSKLELPSQASPGIGSFFPVTLYYRTPLEQQFSGDGEDCSWRTGGQSWRNMA
jgi:hypothetical protein